MSNPFAIREVLELSKSISDVVKTTKAFENQKEIRVLRESGHPEESRYQKRLGYQKRYQDIKKQGKC